MSKYHTIFPSHLTEGRMKLVNLTLALFFLFLEIAPVHAEEVIHNGSFENLNEPIAISEYQGEEDYWHSDTDNENLGDLYWEVIDDPSAGDGSHSTNIIPYGIEGNIILYQVVQANGSPGTITVDYKYKTNPKGLRFEIYGADVEPAEGSMWSQITWPDGECPFGIYLDGWVTYDDPQDSWQAMNRSLELGLGYEWYVIKFTGSLFIEGGGEGEGGDGEEVRHAPMLDAISVDIPTSSISVFPQLIDFGIVPAGETTGPEAVSVTNNSSSNLSIGALTFDGPDAQDFSLGVNTCSEQILIPGSTCTAEVSFSSVAAGEKSAALAIPSDAPDSSLVKIALLAESITSVLEVLPASHDFGSIQVGNFSETIDFTVVNKGNTAFTIVQTEFAGADAGHFEIVGQNCFNEVILPGSNCTIRTNFSPSSSGEKSTNLLVGTDNSAIPVASRTLSGIGGFPYLLTVSKSGNGSGTVSSTPQGIDCGTNCATAFNTGTQVALTAVPANDSNFVDWSGAGCTGNDLCIVTIESDITVTSSFALKNYFITTSAGDGGAVEPDGAITVEHGGNVTFTMIPEAFHHVEDLKIDNVSLGPLVEYTFTNVNESHTIDAGFAIDTYTITATAGEGGSITPAGDIEVAHGSNQMFTISANNGFHIDTVLVNGISVGAVSSYSFHNVSIGNTIEAIFAADTPVIGVSSDNIDFGAVPIEGRSDRIRLYVANEGTGTLEVGSLSFVGAHASDFVITLDNVSETLIPPGTSEAYVELVFTPENTGLRNTQLLLPSNDPDTPLLSLQITGEGIMVATCLTGVPKTGWQTSYALGDDGSLRVGIPWPKPRFTDNRDGTLTDEMTGLIWMKNASPAATLGLADPTLYGITWQEALDLTADINSGLYPSIDCGYNDWRLPNILELESLTYPTENGFYNLHQHGIYWSSTPYVAGSMEAWGTTIGGGQLQGYDMDNRWLGTLLVRGGPSGSPDPNYPSGVKKTGATSGTYFVGSDADVQWGVTIPDPRFTILVDGTVRDNLTGLAWAPNADSPDIGDCRIHTPSWHSALAYIECLNQMNYLGHQDWRLPNSKEFTSLLNFGTYPPMPPGPFTGVGLGVYWTSTPDIGVSLQTGAHTTWEADLAWPVRGSSGSTCSQSIRTYPGYYNFPAAEPGQTPQTVEVRVVNHSQELFPIDRLELEGDEHNHFSLDSDSCFGTTLLSEESCSFTVIFTPKLMGEHSISVRVIAALPTAQDTAISIKGTSIMPGVNLPQTGQDQILAAGDDGDLQSGIPWPDPRFTDNGDGTITDRLTGLMWLKDAGGTGGEGSFDEMNSLAHNLTAAGFSDWRPPNPNEIFSLLHFGEDDMQTWLSSQGFLNVPDPGSLYWTCNYVDNSSSAAYIATLDGNIFRTSKENTPGLMWPVRGGPDQVLDLSVPANIPRTGQRYGQKWGVYWPEPRFISHGDGTVTDNLTGLMWLQNPNRASVLELGSSQSNGLMPWQEALEFIADLNSGVHDAGTTVIYSDWRLPNRVEALSLIDYSNTWIEGRRWRDGLPFLGTFEGEYWTSTSLPGQDDSKAWVVDYAENNWQDDKLAYPLEKFFSRAIWPVRNGNGLTYEIQGDSDLSVLGTVVPDIGVPGDTFSYHFTITNDGPTPAPRVTLSLSLPPGATIVSSATERGALVFQGSEGSCYLGVMASGESLEVSVQLQVVIPGSATLSASLQGVFLDPDTTNNQVATGAELTAVNTWVLSIAKQGNGSGRIVSQPSGIDCGATCTQTVYVPTEVTLTAIADVGHLFEGWSGIDGCDNDSECTVTLDAETTVSASFAMDGLPDIGVTPESWYRSLHLGESVPLEVSITNHGIYQPLEIYNISITDTDPSSFSLVSDACSGQALGPDESCTVDLIFTPGEGPWHAVLQIESNDPSRPLIDIDLEGMGWVPQAPVEGAVFLPQTGQSWSRNATDDGDLQMGVSWPDPRFINNGDGTITDRLTGRMWLANADPTGGMMLGQDALAYIDTLNAGTAVIHEGDDYTANYEDWHLPTILELESLFHCGVDNTAVWLEQTIGFKNVRSAVYFESSYITQTSSGSGADAQHYKFEFNRGWASPHTSHGAGNVIPQEGYVMAVRSSGPQQFPAQVWKTGNLGPGDPGVAWPDPRFNDHGDGTVTDRLTGLMWTQNANLSGLTDYTTSDGKPTMYLSYALQFVSEVNNGILKIKGTPALPALYSDWRLPNRKELFSLMNFSSWEQSLPLGHPFVEVHTEEERAYHFTSSSKTVSRNWSMNFDYNEPYDSFGGDYYYNFPLADNSGWRRMIWLVRGGEGPDIDSDGLPDGSERVAGTDPADADSDDDGLVDGGAGGEDLNGNGMLDLGETDPGNPDTDGDGIFDGTEAGLTQPQTNDTDQSARLFRADIDPATTTNPVDADSDDDGILDGNEDLNRNGEYESTLGETDPNNPDTDGDGIFDGTEAGITQPQTGDTDLSVGFFKADDDPSTTTDPTDADSDDDGILDGDEDLNHNGEFEPKLGETDPRDANSFPLYADLNEDGAMDLTDVILALRICAGMDPGVNVSGSSGIPGNDQIGMEEVIYILKRQLSDP